MSGSSGSRGHVSVGEGAGYFSQEIPEKSAFFKRRERKMRYINPNLGPPPLLFPFPSPTERNTGGKSERLLHARTPTPKWVPGLLLGSVGSGDAWPGGHGHHGSGGRGSRCAENSARGNNPE
eukprot:256840-Amorphochlora_amoeboformis.AAC.1